MTAVAIARRAEPTPAPTMTEIEAQLHYATTIADAAAVLPDGYRKQPGAILLAQEWGRAHGLDLLTTIQNVAFVKGKPVVDASMQRALARRAGYRLAIESGTDSATVTVYAPNGDGLGSVTYTLADAKAAGLSEKDNWRKHTREMLVAAASRLALRWHAPEVLLGVFDADEIDAQTAEVAPFAPAGETPDVVDAEPVDAEVVKEEEEEESPGPDVAEVRASLKRQGITLSTLIPAAQVIARESGASVPSTLDDVIAGGLLDAAIEAVKS